VSEKTDSFAFGIVLVELLISTGVIVDGKAQSDAAQITLNARDLVDTEGELSLSQAVQTLALSGGWAPTAVGLEERKQREQAVETCRVLSDVAALCIANSGRRKIPAQVLASLEKAARAAGALSAMPVARDRMAILSTS
jgi:hypothetical protein